jgi:hypothetical protein
MQCMTINLTCLLNHAVIQGMRDCNRKGTLDKADVSLLSRSRLQLKRREMDQEQQNESEHQTSLLLDGKPIGHRSKRPRRECA